MHIERFDGLADQNGLRNCFEIWTAARRCDDPGLPLRSIASFSGWWTHGFGGGPRQTWLASDDAGEPVGCYLLELPERANPTIARCTLTVAPARRRGGLGTELLAHSVSQARLAGRSRLVSEATDGSPGALFASAVGAASGLPEVLRVLTIDAQLRSRLPGLQMTTQPHAAGYTLVRWLGASPEDHLDDLAQIEGAMADAPRDAGIDHEIWDANRIRKVEQLGIANGWHYFSVAARHDQSGRLVAMTQLGTDPGVPGWAFQHLTAVLKDHRGHRLGLLVKVANLDLLLGTDVGVRSIVTGNAGPNDHMIAINEQLGFTVRSVHRSWELDLTTTP